MFFRNESSFCCTNYRSALIIIMKIYIQSPVFQKIVFNSNTTRRSILEKPLQTPVSRSLNVKRKSSIQPSENRGLSLTIRETQKSFFREPPRPSDEPYQEYVHELQKGNFVAVIAKLESISPNKKTQLLLGIAYKSMNQLDKAKTQFLNLIKEYPTFIDAYIQLSQLEVKLQNVIEAIRVLEQALRIKPNDKQLLLQKARCHTLLKQHKSAMDIYEKVKDLDFAGKTRQAISLMKCQFYDQAMEAVDSLLTQDNENPEALLIKGVLLIKTKHLHEGTIMLEQAIQTSNSSRNTAKALSYIVRAHIQLKDFYNAHLHLKRGETLKKSFKCLQKLRNFVNGTMLLMKRQFKKGLECLHENKVICKFLRPIYNHYLGYAYFCNSEYSVALHHYKQIPNPDNGIEYNKLLCEALIKSQQSNFASAMQLFEAAASIFPNKVESYFYRAAVVIQNLHHEGILQAEHYIQQAFQRQGKQPNLHYVRAILKSYKRRFTSALKDVEKAIDKSEDSQSEHFYLRGLLHAQSMRLKEAIKDFATAIHFNKDYAEAYLQRAKCYQIKGDQNMCFNDLSKFMKLSKNAKRAFYWSGSLLFHNNAYEDAFAAYQDAEQTDEVLLQKLKCQLKLQKIDKAVEVANLLQESQYKCDRLMLQYIKQVVELSNKKSKEKTEISLQLLEEASCLTGLIFRKQDIQLMKAASLLYMKRVNESVEIFKELGAFWMSIQNKRMESISSAKEVDSEQSEDLQNEMVGLQNMKVLKSERIVQHIIGIKYNLLVVYLMTHKYGLAQQMLMDIKEQVGSVSSEELDYLSTVISNQIEKKPSSPYQKLLTFLLNEKSVFLLFPTLRVNLQNTFFDCKLSLNFPDIQPPNICPQFEQDYIQSIKVSLVENKPEAPWLNRTVNQDLVFTQNMLTEDIALTTEDEEEAEEKQSKKRKQQNLALDDQIQRKLDKIIKQK